MATKQTRPATAATGASICRSQCHRWHRGFPPGPDSHVDTPLVLPCQSNNVYRPERRMTYMHISMYVCMYLASSVACRGVAWRACDLHVSFLTRQAVVPLGLGEGGCSSLCCLLPLSRLPVYGGRRRSSRHGGLHKGTSHDDALSLLERGSGTDMEGE
ncbi:hypothetical protein LZ32DRAFT_455467 [Colletotrichum eremochloae]|nr:hypothetical protein LZ32DRAFT_455467 [Colletotrichum eremochloae]